MCSRTGSPRPSCRSGGCLRFLALRLLSGVPGFRRHSPLAKVEYGIRHNRSTKFYGLDQKIFLVDLLSEVFKRSSRFLGKKKPLGRGAGGTEEDMRFYRLMRVGEKCEVRIRFRGNPKQLECVRKARGLLRDAGCEFSVCDCKEGIDWFIEAERSPLRSSGSLEVFFVGSWQASEAYYARFRQLPSRGGDVGHRGDWGGSTLPAIRPNSPGLFGRIKSACCVWLVRHLIHLEYSRMPIVRKIAHWLMICC